MNAPCPSSPTDDDVVHATRHWLTRAVIGLNLCPFARAVHVKHQIRYVVSHATDAAAVIEDVRAALVHLADADPEQVDTTLVITPHALQDFHAFTHCLADAGRLLKPLKLRGVIQIASFHPDYVFADAQSDDIENFTNRAPYPILHLLRESSVERAVAAISDADTITERNQARLRELGLEGWQAWMKP